MDDTNSTKAAWVHEALRQYERPLIQYAFQITGDLERARDVVQDTFVKLCTEDPERLKDCLARWLFTVCRNRALDVRRKERRMVELTDEEIAVQETREPSPAAAAEQRESVGEILGLLALLPPNQREVIRLKFQNGLSYQEISHITNLSVTNVGVLIHTAIKSIRQQLKTRARSEAAILRSSI